MKTSELLKTADNRYDEALIAKLEEWIKSGKLDKVTIAKGINRSDAAVCQYLMKKYPGNVDKLSEELKNYVNLFEKKENLEIKKLEFVETSVAKKLFATANLCQLRGKMGVCIGAPGIGKTTAINEYQKTASGVVIIDPFEHTSAKAVLQQMADQLKINYFQSMSIDVLTLLIIKKLEKNPQLIILDEAENLKVAIFKIIRKIHDRTGNHCGVLFVGTQELRLLLHRVKSGFPYITSRIGYVEDLDFITTEDAESLIRQYFPDCDQTLVQHISKITNKNSRFIQNLLDICFDIVKSGEIQLDKEVIDVAKEKLLI